MKILYLDTSEMTAKLAIFESLRGTGGAAAISFKKMAEESWEAGRELSKTLTGKYEELLKKTGIKQEELEGITVFVGPGSFTGLRIGISFANGLAFALGIPVFETKEKELFEIENPKEIGIPFYDLEPNITKPKKK